MRQMALFGGSVGVQDERDAKNDGGDFMRLPTATSGILESSRDRGYNAMLPVGTARCQCSGCDRYFSSVGSFDKHRRDGHCLDEAAMRARGMLVNAKGFWISQEYTGRGDE